jgi:Metal binding domain of Ada
VSVTSWPSSRDFVEAVQNPRLAFRSSELQDCEPAIDKFGMPLVASGNFAYAFKLRDPANTRATGVRCFRGFIPDRDKRYSAIDRHLDAHANSYLTSFEFDAEGILVTGRRYPIVVMEWVEGPTLDLYVEQCLGNKAALQNLADAWLMAVESLQSSQVAHGDFQHGNLIIQNSQFRFIDFDGMFVPAMQGWTSNEIGHPHYQHPKRGVTDFNLSLDSFSGLVIYLSLISLAEAPDLWREFHDENLVFTKADFLNPDSSRLFTQIKKLGPQQRDLAEVLAKAAKGKPGDSPCVLSLATRKSKLPAWMTAPVDLKIEVKTREAGSSTSVPSATANTAFTPQWKQQTPPPSTVAQVPSPAPVLQKRGRDWSRVHKVAWPLAFKIGFVGAFLFWLWVPFLQGVADLFGIAKADSSTFVFWTYVISCVVISYVVAIRKESSVAAPSYIPGIPSQPKTWTPPSRAPWTLPSSTSTTHYTPAPAGASAAQVVGSKIRFIYHRPTCEWVLKMSYRNKVTFNSSSTASSRGYRPCKVCRP